MRGPKSIPRESRNALFNVKLSLLKSTVPDKYSLPENFSSMAQVLSSKNLEQKNHFEAILLRPDLNRKKCD
jgi:hypothetical protein